MARRSATLNDRRTPRASLQVVAGRYLALTVLTAYLEIASIAPVQLFRLPLPGEAAIQKNTLLPLRSSVLSTRLRWATLRSSPASAKIEGVLGYSSLLHSLNVRYKSRLR